MDVADRLDGFSRTRVYEDGTIIRIVVHRTERETYESGWRYTLHYGSLDPSEPGTLPDGTILRYDNAHEATKGHERHAADGPKAEPIEFPGIETLWRRFWAEIPKTAFDIGGGD